MPSEFVDPYVDLRHNVLRNKVGATTYDELRNAEGEFVALRTCEFLEALPIKFGNAIPKFLCSRCISRR